MLNSVIITILAIALLQSFRARYLILYSNDLDSRKELYAALINEVGMCDLITMQNGASAIFVHG